MKKTEQKTRGLLVIVLAVCWLLTGMFPLAQAGASNVKMGHVAPPFHGNHLGVVAFADYVREKTKGKIDIATFPAGQLGGERSMAEQIQTGTLQLATLTTAVLQNFVPQIGVLDMPFIFPDRKTAYAVLDDSEVQDKLFSYFPKKGFVAIGWAENEFRDFTNNKRAVRTPDDIKGLKVRVMETPIYLDTFKQLGASPVAIPFPETYNALQTGVIDAQDNPLLTTILMKFTEVTKYVTRTQHSLTESVIVVSADYWKSLSTEEQQIFREAAKVCIDTNRKVNVSLHDALPKSNLSIAEYAKENNVEIIELSPSERELFRKEMLPVWDKHRQEIGNDVFDYMLNKIKEHHQ